MPLELEPQHFQKIKIGVHVVQGVFIFVSWAITIAVFKAKDSKVDGRAGWSFGLAFLTIPAIIYLTMTPRFPRTRKFANPYAMASVDGLFCILWLSAFAAVANWNSTGKCGNGCSLSKAVVGLEVIVWLLWILSTLLSLYAVFYYKREGHLPGASRVPTNAQMIDPDKDAFSTAPHDDEYVAVHNTDEHEIHDLPSNSNGHDAYDAPTYGGYAPPTVSDEYTGYQGTGGMQGPPNPLGMHGIQGPGQVGDNGRVHFPTARYDDV